MENFFVITGNIAAGKSTLLGKLKQSDENIWVSSESGQENELFEGLVEKFYADKEKYTFPFHQAVKRHFDSVARAVLQLNESESNKKKIAVVERSPLDVFEIFIVANKKWLTDEQFEYFKNWCEESLKNPPWCWGKIMFLDVPAEICAKRCAKRSRVVESDVVDLDYLKMLEKTHKNMYIKRKFKSNAEPKEIFPFKTQDEIIDKIKTMI
jgi:deoxyadenosine/deoxycytidine kinase